VAASKEIEFCNGNSFICFKLNGIVQNGTEFCERMGIEVRENECYRGVAAAQIKGPVKAAVDEEGISMKYLLPVISALAGLGLSLVLSRHMLKAKPVDVRQARINRFAK
jgi:hypothetical protein